MRRWLWIPIFLVVAWMGDYFAGSMLQKLALNSQFRYARLYNQAAQADILLVGNSRGLTFYQPFIEAQTGKSTFNLSYNGLPAELAEVLVTDYLQRYAPPKKVIIDITLADRHNRELIAGFLPYAAQSSSVDTLIRSQASDAWWGSRVSRLFRCNNEVFQRALYYRNRSDEDWLLDRSIAPALTATVPLDTFPISVQPTLVAALARAVKAAQAKGCEVQLVIAPYFPNMVRDWRQLDAFRNAVEQATGLRVSDYRQALRDTADFGDLMHPNKQGATRWLALLIQEGVL
jgi:hypothetical protein